MTDPASLAALAARVDAAACDGTAIPQISPEFPTLDVADAYEIQRLSIARRLARGERLVGVKMGLTSEAKMRQVGVDSVIWGRLTDAMQVPAGGTISMAGRVHPRVEPEIAFLLKRPLAGVVTRAGALAAVEAILPAMEIIDSRYRNFRFNLVDVIADNASSSGFVLGAPCPADSEIADIAMAMSFDDAVVQSGSSAAILGDPVRALMEAARLVAEAGGDLPAGAIVLAGAATEAVPLKPGIRVRVEVAGLGAASFSVAGEPA